jgi:hypothetical protein
MEEKKMMVEVKKKKEQQRRSTTKTPQTNPGEIFRNLSKGWASEKKKKTPPQCLVWVRLNGLCSSQNGQNRLIHNWCVAGCWFTQAKALSQGQDIWVCVCICGPVGNGF